MATRVRPFGAANLALELGGVMAGTLRSWLPPSYRINPINAADGQTVLRAGRVVSLGPLAAEVNLLENGPLLDWLMSLPRETLPAQAGAVLVLDLNQAARRRVDFGDSLVTELSLPRLSATSGKQPFSVGVVWRAATLTDNPGSGKKGVPGKPKGKGVQCGNFRLQGLPFDASAITDVGLPTLRGQASSSESRLPARRYAAVDHGELSLRLLARSADEALAWVRKTLADGRLDDSKYLDLTVELLDPSLKNVLLVVSLKGCGLLACDEARIDTSVDTVGGVTLRFGVERVEMMFTGG